MKSYVTDFSFLVCNHHCITCISFWSQVTLPHILKSVKVSYTLKKEGMRFIINSNKRLIAVVPAVDSEMSNEH